MALIRCPECGKQVSDKAESCQGCGFPISSSNNPSANNVKKPQNNTKTPYGMIIATAIIGFIFIAQLGGNRRDYSRTTSFSNSPYSSSSSSSSYSYSSTPKTGREGALAKANSYLNSMAYSYEDLIEQLEYTGFSSTEAKYAADNCGANWKEQALRKAKSYLNSSAYSYKGLIEQLEYSGFTSDEAKYGADHCGANWKEQAVKKPGS